MLVFLIYLLHSRVIHEIDPLHLKAFDRPEIVAREFKIKLELLTDLTKRHVLGKVLACKSCINFI